MLFNSYVFIFLFLPIVFFGYLLARGKGHRRIEVAWLTFASFCFYGYWKPIFLPVLCTSILVNYAIVRVLVEKRVGNRVSAVIMAAGVILNLIALAYFKYFSFFVININDIFRLDLVVPSVLLPLGISFFTFLQIALVVDAYRGEVRAFSLLDHAFFVTFFPHLIAGPLIHHGEFIPQLYRTNPRSWDNDLAVGLGIFIIGLFKKVVIADTLAIYADAGYAAIHGAQGLDVASAWITICGYALQIYFDFSGYSDMAVGLARMVGLWLPVNFFSPYKAMGFVDFWRRWHITLSRFLKEYLYISLGGNRRGKVRQYINLTLVMLLGGLWHGADWKFAIWGGAHGFLLVLDHAWAYLPVSRAAIWKTVPARVMTVAFTFIVIALVWVPFRAETLGDAVRLLAAAFPTDPGVAGHSIAQFIRAQFTINQATLNLWFTARELWPQPLPPDFLATKAVPAGFVLALAGGLAFFAPNTSQLFARFDIAPGNRTAPGKHSIECLGFRWASVLAVLFVVSLFGLSHLSPFLYFQF